MPSAQAKPHVKEGYVNKSFSIEKSTEELVERVADEYGMPRSCVVNIALSRPAKFQKLIRASEDGETAAIEAVKEAPGLAQQFLDWINSKDASESESGAGEEGSEEKED